MPPTHLLPVRGLRAPSRRQGPHEGNHSKARWAAFYVKREREFRVLFSTRAAQIDFFIARCFGPLSVVSDRPTPGRRQPPARCSTGCGAPVRGQCRRSGPAPWHCWGQRRARESSGLFGRSRRAADEASIWRPSGSITTAESRRLTLARLAGVWGVVGAWMSASGLRKGDRQAAPKAEKQPFFGSTPPRYF